MARKRNRSRSCNQKRPGMRRSMPTFSSALTETGVQWVSYMEWFETLLMMRYSWDGLPETCDERYLEYCLNHYGMATIAHDEALPDVWCSLQAAGQRDYNMYGTPQRWFAQGYNGRMFNVTAGVNGAIGYDRKSRNCFWPKYEAIAQKLALYSRVEECNLFQQLTPYIVSVPEEQIGSVLNALGLIGSGNMAIVGYDRLGDLVKQGIDVLNTGVEWKGDKLQAGALGTLSEFFRVAGIPHLQFEKRERMITGEAESSNAPTMLALMDGLEARQRLCEDVNKLGLSVSVKVNPEINEIMREVVNDAGTDGVAGE